MGGNPAQVITYRFDEATIERLLSSRWWNYDPRQVFHSLGTDFTELLEGIDAGELTPCRFAQVTLPSAP